MSAVTHIPKEKINTNIQLIGIDLFCGAGGVTTGIEQAVDGNGNKIAKVIACVNHDPLAIESHKSNHPDALHFIEDIRTLNVGKLKTHLELQKKLYPNAKVLLWASLECTHFSNAKGGDARDADSRSLANHLFRYIDELHPDIIGIENVREFMSWGEMGQRLKDGKYQIIKNKKKDWFELPYKGNEQLYQEENIKPALYPIKRKKGLYYLRWVENIKKRGYNFDHKLLNCADYGAYTARIRYFAFFMKKSKGDYQWKINFPKPTHAKTPDKNTESILFDEQPKQLEKWKPVKDVLELEDEGNSILVRKKTLSDKTLERIYAGLLKYVGGGNKQVQAFISKYYSGDPMSKNASIEEPAHTITTPFQGDHHSLIQPCWLVKFLSNNAKTGINKGASIENPAPTITTQGRIGIAQCNFLSTYYRNGSNYSTDGPAPTVTTKDRICKITAKPLNKQYGSGEHNHQSINELSEEITTTPKLNLVNSQFLMNPQFKNNGSSIENPCFTLIASMNKRPPYLISTEEGLGIEIYETDNAITKKIKVFMALYGIYDIKMRMLNVSELKRITGFPDDYVLKGNQANQKKFIGNAVPVLMAQRLIEHLVKVNS
jgi:DNA (cytosine-5)-methyltransferase 1